MRKLLLACCFVGLTAQFSLAEIVVAVGDHDVLANTANQQIDVLVSTDGGQSPTIFGSNLHFQLADGTGPIVEPVFNGFSIDGSIFDVTGSGTAGGVVGGGQFIDASATPPAAGVDANGILVSLLIDTTGITSGTFALSGTITEGGANLPTQLLDGNAAARTLVINDGSVTISAVPEPSSVVIVVAFGGIVLCRRRR